MKTVYRFRKYDITTDTMKQSRRWATKEAIAKHRGEAIEDTQITVDEALLGNEVDGMTDIGFNPNQTKGFQTRVTT